MTSNDSLHTGDSHSHDGSDETSSNTEQIDTDSIGVNENDSSPQLSTDEDESDKFTVPYFHCPNSNALFLLNLLIFCIP